MTDPACLALIELCVYRMVAHEIGQFLQGDLGYRAARTCNRSRAEHNALDETNANNHPFAPATCGKALVLMSRGWIHEVESIGPGCPAGHEQEAPLATDGKTDPADEVAEAREAVFAAFEGHDEGARMKEAKSWACYPSEIPAHVTLVSRTRRCEQCPGEWPIGNPTSTCPHKCHAVLESR